jgi:predicted ATP-dependent endonuclease of OLD family
MRILRLYIQGCGVFKSNLIDFTHNDEPQNLICLAGVNGSGKTTVMELVFSLLSFLNPNFTLEDIYFDRLKPHILTRVDFAQLDMSIDDRVLSIVWGSKNQRQKKISGRTVTDYIIVNPQLRRNILDIERDFLKKYEDAEISELKTMMAHNMMLKRSNGKNKRDSNIHFPLSKLLEDISSKNKDNLILSSETAKAFPLVYFFNAHDREIHDIHYTAIPKDVYKYQLICRYHPKKDDIKKSLIYYDYAHSTEFEKLKSWINEYVLVDKSIEGIDRPNFEVIVRTQNGTTHGLELLSSGEESLLIVAIQCFLRASKNAVFMIDEVDQSLHPEFQEKMMMLLTQLQKDTDCQIIVSSHSEIIWRMFDSQGLIDLTSVVMT